MKRFILTLNEKAKEAEAMRKAIAEYQELVSKQNAIIGTVKELTQEVGLVGLCSL